MQPHPAPAESSLAEACPLVQAMPHWLWRRRPPVPPEWRPSLACVNQVWVPSRFTAAAPEPLWPGRVRVVPPPATLPPRPSALRRVDFGLPEDAVTRLRQLADDPPRRDALGPRARVSAQARLGGQSVAALGGRGMQVPS